MAAVLVLWKAEVVAAMRAMWKGAISFGLVGIAVKLYTATEAKDIAFHQVHAADGGRINMRRVCEADGAEVPYAEIVKGFEYVPGEMVLLTEQDLAKVPMRSGKTITVERFVPAEQVDPIYFDKAYFLAPDGTASQIPYQLLLQSLQRTGRVGLVKITLRQKERLAAIRPGGDGVLVLSMMLWPDEVRVPDFGFLDQKIAMRPAELKMAAQLLDSMAGEFHAEDYTDDYRQALTEVVQAKLEGRTLHAENAPRSTKDTDLLSALTASLDQARERRGAGGGKARTKTSSSKRSSAAEPAKKATARARKSA